MRWPSRISCEDNGFVCAVSFLFFRFKADCYWYMFVPAMRNMLIASVPVLPNATVQFASVLTLVLPSLLVTVRTYPWRADQGNVLDVVVRVVMLMVTSLAGLFATDRELVGAAWISLMYLLFVAVAILITACRAGSVDLVLRVLSIFCATTRRVLSHAFCSYSWQRARR